MKDIPSHQDELLALERGLRKHRERKREEVLEDVGLRPGRSA